MKKVPLTWEDRACLGSCPLPVEGTFQGKNSARTARVSVSADGRGLVSQAGSVLLWETMRVTGLGRGLSEREPGPVAGAAGGPRPGKDRRGPGRSGRAGR